MDFPVSAISEPIGKVFEDRLAHSLGLDSYRYIMDHVLTVDISADEDFQKTFNRYYVVRKNKTFRDGYYSLFRDLRDSLKNSGQPPAFEQILYELYKRHGTVEASFASKMLATLDSDKPILDSNVLARFGLAVKGNTPERRLESAVEVYHRIGEAYRAFIHDGADEWIAAFDRALPAYRDISPVKKIDTMLWCAPPNSDKIRS